MYFCVVFTEYVLLFQILLYSCLKITFIMRSKQNVVEMRLVTSSAAHVYLPATIGEKLNRFPRNLVSVTSTTICQQIRVLLTVMDALRNDLYVDQNSTRCTFTAAKHTSH